MTGRNRGEGGTREEGKEAPEMTGRDRGEGKEAPEMTGRDRGEGKEAPESQFTCRRISIRDLPTVALMRSASGTVLVLLASLVVALDILMYWFPFTIRSDLQPS